MLAEKFFFCFLLAEIKSTAFANTSPDYEHPYNDNHCQKLSVFSRVNATLEAAMLVGRSVGRSVGR